MKLYIVLLSLSVLVVTSSCKKDWGCTCHTIVNSGYGNAEAYEDTVFVDVSKKDAETRCTGLNENISTYYGSWTTTCELK